MLSLEINEQDVQELIKQTIVSRVTSYVDTYLKKDGRHNFNDQVIERYIREAIRERVWSITSDKFDEVAKDIDKKELCESLALKMYSYLFDNY